MWDPYNGTLGRGRKGGFTEPSPVPGVDPGCGELVVLWCHPSWIALLLGAGAQLVQPSTWATSDPADLALVLSQATDLLANLAVAARGTRRGPRPIANGSAPCVWVKNRTDGLFVLND